MSIIQTHQIYPNFQKYENYYMSLNNSTENIQITLLSPDILTTHSLPHTRQILKEYFPNVLKTSCFNDAGLPFHEEVKNTEIGHLFEHIMLSFLCELKVKSGFKKVSFRGVTEWNWKKDAKGTFHIKINIKSEDVIYINDAYTKSHEILKLILNAPLTSLESIN